MRNDNARIPELLRASERDGIWCGAILNAVLNPGLSLLLPVLLASLMMALPSRAATPKEAALHALGLRTIQAIADGNAPYIVSVADPKGIHIGYDGVRHSADSFKNDLARHVGVYCELFEKNCKVAHNPNYTLEHVFRSGAKPTSSDLKFKIDGDEGTLEYWEFGGAGDLIATLSYRFADGKWYLYNIHFV